MKSHIRNARVYKAFLPDASVVEGKLEQEGKFLPPEPSQSKSSGFVPVLGTGRYLLPIEGGFAVQFRLDRKVVPPTAVEEKLAELVAAIEHEHGRKPGKKERRALREDVILELLPKVLPRTSTLLAVYDAAPQYLTLASTSKSLADEFFGRFIDLLASVKTTTIHVSSVKQGLTTRLKGWTETGEDGLFDDFSLAGDVSVVRPSDDGNEKAAYQLLEILRAQAGLREVLEKGFQVSSIGLEHRESEVRFTLTDKFDLRGIDGDLGHPLESDNADDALAHQIGVESMFVREIVDSLCKLFDHHPELPAEDDDPAPV